MAAMVVAQRRAGSAVATGLVLLSGVGAVARPADAARKAPVPARSTGTYDHDTCAGVGPQGCEVHRYAYEIVVQRLAAADGGRTATVTARAIHPFGVFLKAATAGGRRVDVTWVLTCTRASGALTVASTRGHYATRSGGRRYLPLAVDPADGCSLSATASTARGRVGVTAYGEVPGRLISDTVIAQTP